ncbi:MAG: guanylate kinase [Dehalococcoidales bacterium]|nr:guanylate kinase [Dehalococcoidales bacterium]
MSRDRRSTLGPPAKPLLIVLSGLSGVGKDTVLVDLKKSSLPVFFSVSATTRARRSGEKEGADYYFVSTEKFQQMIDADELLEWATVYGNRYGIPRAPVRQAIERGQDVIVKIDVQGAATIRKKVPGAVLIFLVTSTLDELESRLNKRRTESPEELELRLKTAVKELDSTSMFDYIVVNRHDEIRRTIDTIKAIVTAEKCRILPRDLSI